MASVHKLGCSVAVLIIIEERKIFSVWTETLTLY